MGLGGAGYRKISAVSIVCAIAKTIWHYCIAFYQSMVPGKYLVVKLIELGFVIAISFYIALNKKNQFAALRSQVHTTVYLANSIGQFIEIFRYCIAVAIPLRDEQKCSYLGTSIERSC